MTSIYFWLFAVIFFSVAEAITAGLVSIWFIVGSVASLIAASLHASTLIQIIVFIFVSAISLILTRPLVKKKLTSTTPTNADMLIGSNAIVDEEINNLTFSGSVKVNGKIWSAKSSNDEVIASSSVVTILRIEGVKLIVELSK